MLSVRVYLHLNFTNSNVIWILDETHSCHKIRFVTILRIFRSFSRSKPSLTIAPEFGKTIEKPLISMVDLQKNIQWWWSRDGKTIEKPSMAMVPWKKNITIPSLWKNDHRRSLNPTQPRPLWRKPQLWLCSVFSRLGYLTSNLKCSRISLCFHKKMCCWRVWSKLLNFSNLAWNSAAHIVQSE